jgi:hypothetical protein
VHPGAVGFVRLQQRTNVRDPEASRQLFIHALTTLATGFNVQCSQVVAFVQ